MKCTAENCGGIVNTDISVPIFTPCHGYLPLHPCGTCGLLHWGMNGSPVFDRRAESFKFLKNGVIVDEDGNESSLDNDYEKGIDEEENA